MSVTITKTKNGYLIRSADVGRDAYDITSVTVVEGFDTTKLAQALQNILSPVPCPCGH